MNLVHYLIGTAAAGKGFGLGFKGIAHTQYVAHGLAQRLVAFELRVGVDVGMHLHIYVVPVKEVAQLVGYLYAMGHLYQHALLYGVGLCGLFVTHEHKAAALLAQEYNNCGKFCFSIFHLRVGADAYLQFVACFALPDDRVLYFFFYGLFQ